MVEKAAQSPYTALTLLSENVSFMTSWWRQQECESRFWWQYVNHCNKKGHGRIKITFLEVNKMPVLTTQVLVKIVLYLRGLWMVTYQLNAIVNSTEASVTVNKWMKNSWKKHAAARISWTPSKNSPKVVLKEERDKPMSEMGSMERK